MAAAVSTVSGRLSLRYSSWACITARFTVQVSLFIRLRFAFRSFAEFEQEFNSAQINRNLNADMETLLIPSDPALSFVSSSAVRELASFGGDIGPWVPESVRKDIQEALSKNIPVKE